MTMTIDQLIQSLLAQHGGRVSDAIEDARNRAQLMACRGAGGRRSYLRLSARWEAVACGLVAL